MPIPWPRPLTFRTGSPHLLAGIEVYHDFDWDAVFKHPQRAFKNGRRLALLVRSDCPDDKTAALLLTDDPNAEEDTVETDTHYVAIIRIDRYLETSADPAATYFARQFTARGGVSSIHRYDALIRNAGDLDALLESHLSEDAIRRRIGGKSDRLDLIRRIAESGGPPEVTHITPAELGAYLDSLSDVPTDLLNALAAAASRAEPETLRTIVMSITETLAGRTTAAAVLAERFPERIQDLKARAALYRALVNTAEAGETDLQHCIEDYPWILGLEYTEVLPRHTIPRGAVDFLVRRHDGFVDFLELKGPNDRLIVTSREPSGEAPASPSSYSLGPALAQALAQVQMYREVFTSHEHTLYDLYGIRQSREPRAMIVMGRVADLSDMERTIFRQLNQSLHRIEVVPFDLLADRADAQIASMEVLLQTEMPAPANEGDVPFHDRTG